MKAQTVPDTRGSASERDEGVTASGRIRPALMCAIDAGMEPNRICA